MIRLIVCYLVGTSNETNASVLALLLQDRHTQLCTSTSSNCVCNKRGVPVLVTLRTLPMTAVPTSRGGHGAIIEE